MLTHGNLAANLRQMLAIPEILRADDIGLVALPLFHVFGLNVALGLSLATGAALVLDTGSTPSPPWTRSVTSGSRRARRAHHVRRLGRHAGGEQRRLGRWPVSGGPSRGRPRSTPTSPCGSRRRYGIQIWQGYGLTEASPAVSTSFGTGRNRPGSVGRPLPGVEVRLVDEEDEHALEGDPGEIWVRGANVFAGYWDDPAATRWCSPPTGGCAPATSASSARTETSSSSTAARTSSSCRGSTCSRARSSGWWRHARGGRGGGHRTA